MFSGSSQHRPEGQVRDDEIIQEERNTAGEALRGHSPQVEPLNQFSAEEEIPKPDGDTYEKLLAPLLERDKIQCDAWKDEVQNLLIFAGLFSAVVTAFVIESYKGLQPDPNDTVITLLTRIADRLDANGTLTLSPEAVVSPFAPTSDSIRINIFWFISLILSLTTVLVGIISLQWLREHQRYDSFQSSELRFAIFNLRAEGLASWYVPQIFAAMPLGLQAALVLFFVGTVEFLLALNHEVAAPVIAIIGLAFLFLLATTLLPTFQAYSLGFAFLLQVNDDVPVPVPFKSPQSYIIRRLSSISKHFFVFAACIYAPLHLVMISLPYHLTRAAKNLVSRRKAGVRDWAPFLKQIHYTWTQPAKFTLFSGYWTSHSSWTLSDAQWPRLRTQYASLLHDCTQDTYGSQSWDFASYIPNVYDCTRGFRAILRETQDFDQVHRVFHSGVRFSRQYEQGVKGYKRRSNEPFSNSDIRSKSRALEVLLESTGSSYRDKQDTLPWPQFGIRDAPLDFDIIHALHVRAVLSLTMEFGNTNTALEEIHLAWAKCQLHFVRPLLVNHPGTLFGVLDRQSLAFQLFHKHEIALIPDLSRQWTTLLNDFFQVVATSQDLLQYTKMWDGRETIALDALDIVSSGFINVQTPDDTLLTVTFIIKTLGDAIHGARSGKPRPDFLAYSACRYLLAWLNNEGSPVADVPPVPMVLLLKTLKTYTSQDDHHRIIRHIKENFMEMEERFRQKYPGHADVSLTELYTSASRALNHLSSQRNQQDGAPAVLSSAADIEEHHSRDSIV